MAKRLPVGAFVFVFALAAASGSVLAATTTLDISDAATSTRSTPVVLPFPLARGGDLGFDVVLNYHTIDGSAVAGTDYTAPVGVSIAPAGTSSLTIPVQVLANTGTSAARTFQLQLDAALGVGNAPEFPAQQPFTTGSAPTIIVSADINGDGMLDLICLDQVDQTISVLLNTTPAGATTATFAPQQTFPAGAFAQDIAVADLNGDGKPDVVAANYTTGAISVLTNITPTGATSASFGTQPSIAVDAHLVAVTAVDVNGDGRPDIVVASGTNNRLAVLRNTTPLGAAAASFATPVFLPSGGFPESVQAADVNGDGKPDLVCVNNTDNTVSVFLNTTDVGSGTPAFTTKTDFAAGSQPSVVKTTDLNGDGAPDLVVVNGAGISILRNTTAAGAIAPSFDAPQPFAAGPQPASVFVADTNADGLPDLVVANYGGSSASVLRNLTAPGASAFRFADPIAFPAGFNPSGVVAADLNGDGRADIAVTNRNSSTLSVFLNATPPSAASVAFAPFQSVAGLGSAYAIAVADFNGDGKPDFAIPSTNGDFLTYLDTTAPGATTATLHMQLFAANGSTTSGIAVADFNGDGKPDVVVSNQTADDITVALNTTAPGAANASFGTPVFFGSAEHPMGVCVADFNGDGKPDVASGTFDGNVVSVFVNTIATGATTPAFAITQSFTVGNHDQAIACADLNGDGKADIVVANTSDNSVSVLRNTTALGATVASFATQQTFATSSGPSGVAIADVNGDGRPDILVANANSGTVSVLLNTTASGAPAFSFAGHVDFAAQAGATWIAASDVDGDGRLDLIVANRFAHSVSVLINTTAIGSAAPNFAAATALQTDDDPMAVALVDLNGDGHADIVTANASATASVLLSTRFQATLGTATATGTINHDLIFADGFD